MNEMINYLNITGANNVNFRIIVRAKNEQIERMNSVFTKMKQILPTIGLDCHSQITVLQRYKTVTKKISLSREKLVFLVNLKFAKRSFPLLQATKIGKEEENTLNRIIEESLKDLNLKNLSSVSLGIIEELNEQKISIKEKKVFTFQFGDFPYRMNASIFAFLSLKSSYFNTLYNSNFRETIEKTVHISDIHLEEFKLLIKNVLQLDLTSDNIYTLLELSERFSFIELEAICKDWFLQLLKKLDSENFLALWQENTLFAAIPIFQEAASILLRKLAAENKQKFIEFCRECIKKKITFQTLDLSRGLKIDGECLKELTPLSIQHLDLSYTFVKWEELRELQKWETLSHLNLSSCSYSLSGVGDLDSFSFLKKIPHLRGLILSGLALSDYWLFKLQQFTSLESLDISMTQFHRPGFKDLSALQSLNALQNLNLSGWGIDEESLNTLKTLTALQGLTISDVNLSKNLMHKLFPRLRNLSLYSCTLAKGIFESLKELKLFNLDLSFCNLDISDLVHLQEMTFLERLNLSHIPYIGNAEMEYLKGLNLKYLDLSETDVSDEGLAAIKKIKPIEHLNLSLTEITDKGLQHIVECKFLQSLDLSECKITDEGLAQLKSLKSLRFLTVKDCPMITKNAISNLKQRFPLLILETKNWREKLMEEKNE